MEKVKINLVVPDPNQPRKLFEPTKLKVLKESIEEHGIMSPLIVEKNKDGKFLIVDGERRFRAASELGLKEVPIIAINPQTEVERLIQQFHIQEQHEGWTQTEKAMAIEKLAERMNKRPFEVLREMGIPERTAQTYIAYMKIIDKESWDKTNTNIAWANSVQSLKIAVKYAYRDDEEKYDRNVEKKIERNTLKAIESGDVEKRNDIVMLKDAFKQNHKLIAEFLDGKNVSDILEKAKSRSAYYLRNFNSACTYLGIHGNKFMEKPDTKVNEMDIRYAKQAYKVVKEFLDKYAE